MFILWQGSLEANPSILTGSFLYRTLPYGPFPWKCLYAMYFCFVLYHYNILLTNLVCSNCTGEYWKSVIFVWTKCTYWNLGQYSSVLPSPSVSKRLLIAESSCKVVLQDQNKFIPSPSSRRLSRFVIVSSPASRTLVSSSFVSSTSSGIIILCVLSSLSEMSRFYTQSINGKQTSQLVAGISNRFKA